MATNPEDVERALKSATCKLTGEIMHEPAPCYVKMPNGEWRDLGVFEKSVFRAWVKETGTNPIDNSPIAIADCHFAKDFNTISDVKHHLEMGHIPPLGPVSDTRAAKKRKLE